MEIRPVGTEFWYEFPPQEHSTEYGVHRIKYRVVEHVVIEDGLGREIKVERLKSIAVEALIEVNNG